jgi:hypothetical protein
MFETRFARSLQRSVSTAMHASLIGLAHYFSDRLNGTKKVSFNRALADPHDTSDFDRRQIIHEPKSKSGQLLHRNEPSSPPNRLNSLREQQNSLRGALGAGIILVWAGKLVFDDGTPTLPSCMVPQNIHSNLR